MVCSGYWMGFQSRKQLQALELGKGQINVRTRVKTGGENFKAALNRINASKSVSQRFILSKSYSIEKTQYNNIHSY